jgi:hypothetical protein
MTPLTGSSQPIVLSGAFRIRAPGIVGTANLAQHRSMSGATRSISVALEGDALDRALSAQDMQDIATIDVTTTARVAPPPGSAVRAPGGDDALELEVPAPPAGSDVVVIAVDESGAITWHYPLTDSNTIETPITRGAGKTVKFRIASATGIAPKAGAQQKRSIFGIVGKKILKVLVYPITDKLVGPLVEQFAEHWEAQHRPYRLRTVTPDNYAIDTAPSLTTTDADWTRLSAGRSLFFVHGTFSSTDSAFAGLDKTDVEALSQAYGGRLFGFDHFTLSHSPEQNVEQLVALLPPGIALDADILCHSRGGLVAREIVERGAAHGLDQRLQIGKVVFVGVPNAGTILTEPDHMTNMIDRFTTAIDVLPDNPATYILETIITAVKVVGHGGLKSLRGLASMLPNGEYLATLGGATTGSTTYFGIAANFDAKGTPFDKIALKLRAGNILVDRIFENAQNDLVVPTDGVAHGSGTRFPIDNAEMLLIDGSAGVTHTTYFRNQSARDKLKQWLVS